MIILLKASEVVFQIESFPLTHMGMFSAYKSAEQVPRVYTIEALRIYRWHEMRPWMLRLSPDEVKASLEKDLDTIGQQCGGLGNSFNRSKPTGLRIRKMRLRIAYRARPGTGAVDRTELIDCPLEPVAKEES